MNNENDIKNIDTICKTYNFQNINNLSNSTIDFLKKIINNITIELNNNEIDNKLELNKELIYLLNNYFYPKPYKHINYIYSLGTVTNMYSELYNMNIYLFGDYHVTKYNCNNFDNSSDISSFLDEQIKTSTKQLDIYIESAIYSNMNKYNILTVFNKDLYLHNFTDKYIDCLTKDKTKCKYPYIRLHSTDLRKNYNEYYHYIFDMYKYMYNIYISLFDINGGDIVYYNTNIDNINKNIKNIKGLLIYSNNVEDIKSLFSDKKKLKESIDTNFKKETKIYKQILNIEDYELRDKIIEYTNKYWFNDNIDKYFEYINYNNIISWINNFENHIRTHNNEYRYLNKLISDLENITDGLQSIVSYYMDTYLITRLFRKYEKKKFKYSDRSTNIIIYTGNAHIKKYIDILKYIGSFNILYSNEQMKTNEYCIDIKDLKQPLFRD